MTPVSVRRAALLGVLVALLTAVLNASAAALVTSHSCTDGGGLSWRTRAAWGSSYVASDGVRRVSIPSVAWTTARASVATISTLRSYDGAGRLVGTVSGTRWHDYAGGTSWDGRNPVDPPSSPGKAKVVLSVGRASDGLADCTVTHVQPAGTTIAAYLTGYTWWDNDPPGSAAIAHPLIHQSAAGAGTYADPITVAVGLHADGTPEVPWGTRWYVPELDVYGITEDSCAACDSTPAGVSIWIDLWLDGRNLTSSQADTCAYAITGNQTVVRNPAPGLPVRSTPVCPAS